MAAERDVTLKIRTAASGDGGKAMQDLAARTREAQREQEKLGKAMQDTARQAQQAAAAARTSPAGGAQAPALPAPPRPGGGASAGFGAKVDKGIDSFAGALTGVTGGLMGLAAAVKVADMGLRALPKSFEGGKFSWDKFGTNLMEDLSGTPLIGIAFEMSNQVQAKREHERRLADAQQAGQGGAVRAGARSEQLSRGLGLGSEMARLQAVMGMGGLGLGDQGGIAGPARQVAMANAEAAFLARAQQQAQVEAAMAMRGVDRQRSMLSATTSERGKEVARQNLANAEAEAQARIADLMKVQEASMAVQQKRQEAMLQLAQARVDKLRSEKQVQDSIVEAEKQKLQSAAGQWGGLSAADRMRAQQVGQTLAARGIEGLAPDQLEFARSIQLFSRTIQEQQQARGEQDQGFKDLVRLLGEDKALGKAQQISVDLENKINAEIKVNEAALATQLQTQVMPRIQEAIDAGAQQTLLTVQRWLLQQRAQRPA